MAVGQAESQTQSVDYVGAFVRPFTLRPVHWFLGLEVFLVVAGYLIATQGEHATGVMVDHPHPAHALGAVMGALAIAFALMFIAVYVILVVINLRTQSKETISSRL